MFTGVFKDRSAKDRIAKDAPRDVIVAAEQALAELLTARELFADKSLIVELAPTLLDEDSVSSNRYQARLKFLSDMGYTVLAIAPQEILRHPQRSLAKLRSALERTRGESAQGL